MTHGMAVTGASDTQVAKMRSTAAHLLSDARQGRSITLQLMLADSSPSQQTDPMFLASELPIVAWANEIWSGECSRALLKMTLAEQRTKLAKAKHPWAKVHGPVGAFVLTCARLHWQILDAT
eukprot:1450986-Karenia_brevis.AAC.1